MIRNKPFTTLCGIAILSGAALAQVISTPPISTPVMDPAPVPVVKSAHPESDRYANNVIGNLTFISRALMQYSIDNENGPLPEHLGRIVGDVPSIEVFVSPGTRVPPQILNGPPLQQSAWVQQHTTYAFPAAGKNISALSSEDVILHERLDMEPYRPMLGTIFADGSVKMVYRNTLEQLLRRQ